MVFAIPLSCIAGAGLVVAQEPMARSVMGDFFICVDSRCVRRSLDV